MIADEATIHQSLNYVDVSSHRSLHVLPSTMCKTSTLLALRGLNFTKCETIQTRNPMA